MLAAIAIHDDRVFAVGAKVVASAHQFLSVVRVMDHAISGLGPGGEERFEMLVVLVVRDEVVTRPHNLRARRTQAPDEILSSFQVKTKFIDEVQVEDARVLQGDAWGEQTRLTPWHEVNMPIQALAQIANVGVLEG